MLGRAGWLEALGAPEMPADEIQQALFSRRKHGSLHAGLAAASNPNDC